MISVSLGVFGDDAFRSFSALRVSAEVCQLFFLSFFCTAVLPENIPSVLNVAAGVVVPFLYQVLIKNHQDFLYFANDEEEFLFYFIQGYLTIVLYFQSLQFNRFGSILHDDFIMWPDNLLANKL